MQSLFGDGFELKIKEETEAVWVLHKGQSRQTQRQCFQGNLYYSQALRGDRANYIPMGSQPRFPQALHQKSLQRNYD